MRKFRFAILVLALASFLAASYFASAADEPRRPGRGRFQGRPGFRFALLPPGAEEKLKLTDEQKEKLATLQKDFESKQKETFGKVRDEMKKAFEDRDREAARKAMEKMREMRPDAEKLRDEYQTKAEALLTDAQKKGLAEMKSERPRFGPPGEGRRDFGRGPRDGGMSPGTMERLRLTDDQKEKIAKLRKELDAKIKDVLTDEQKKKLEEMEKERSRDRDGSRRRGRRPADI